MNSKTIRGISDVVHPRTDEGNNDKAYRDDIAFPRLAQIVRRYSCIPTTDGYIEKWGDQDVYVHYDNTSIMPAKASRNRTAGAQQHQSLRPRQWPN